MPAGSCQFIADARGSALALPRHTTLIMQRLGIRRRLRALAQTVVRSRDGFELTQEGGVITHRLEAGYLESTKTSIRTGKHPNGCEHFRAFATYPRDVIGSVQHVSPIGSNTPSAGLLAKGPIPRRAASASASSGV